MTVDLIRLAFDSGGGSEELQVPGQVLMVLEADPEDRNFDCGCGRARGRKEKQFPRQEWNAVQ